jgi:glutathione S-transferase
MSQYTIFGRGKSGSYFVECLLQKANVDYKFETVSYEETKKSDFLKVNPLARTPVLVTPEGQTIIESVAIFLHLVEKFPVIAPEANSFERNLMWQHLAVLSTSLFASYWRVHHTANIAPEENHKVIHEYAAIEANKWLNYLEDELKPYLAGASPLAADYYFFMMTRWAPDADLLVENRPKLKEFISLMNGNETVMNVNQLRGIA